MVPVQVAGENKKAYGAFCDYTRLGGGRSLTALVKLYQSYTDSIPPSIHIATLKKWSAKYQWQDRVAAYDAAVQSALEAQAAQKRAEVMESGLAQDYERVRELKALAALLREEVFDPKKRWVEDVKQIGSGEKAEKVTIVRFNAPLVDQYRATLNDIALEVGDRKARHEVTGKDGAPIDLSLVTMTAAEDEVRAWRERMKAQLSMPNALGPVIISSTNT